MPPCQPRLNQIFIFLQQYPWWSMFVPNLEFLASAVGEIWRKSKIPQNGHMTPCRHPLTQIFIFFTILRLATNLLPYYEFLASAVADICMGSQNSRKSSHDPLATAFDPIFHFLQQCAPGDRSACQIPSFWLQQLPRNGGGLNFPKMGI